MWPEPLSTTTTKTTRGDCCLEVLTARTGCGIFAGSNPLKLLLRLLPLLPLLPLLWPRRFSAAAAAATMGDFSQPGPHAVSTHTGEWVDGSRARTVPWLLRLPSPSAATPSPVVVMSHGLGGMREGLSRLSTHLASHGYAVLHVQHAGSDVAIWSSGGVAQAMMPEAFQNRMADIPFAVQQLRAMNERGPFAHRFDTSRMAMAGHSYGAITTQVMAGYRTRFGRSQREAAFKAFVMLSPSDRPGSDYADMHGPCLFVTGTHDTAAVTPSVTPESRQRPFRALRPGVPAVLLVLRGGDHYVLGDGVGIFRPLTAADATHYRIIDSSVLAFLNTSLSGDASARSWLVGGGLRMLAGENAQMEQKGW
eukprot:m.192522 g.192522  ORF g.192522 m.192522 type:complete len:364 (+) comp17586_c2_seq11:1477-2568(+)